MRIQLLLVGLLCSTTAFAQSNPPPAPPPPASPMVGDKPLVQVKPRTPPAAAAKPTSIATKLQACLDIEDGSKERLNCYDAVFVPKPNPKAPAAKSVADCRFMKEEDERLGCFNGFVEKLPKAPKS